VGIKPEISWKIFLPGSAGGLFIYILGCFLFFKPLLLLWEGGTCRHLVTGEYFVRHFSVPTTNYVSALFPNVPCLTHSFLGDVILGFAGQFFGLNGVIAAVSLGIVISLMWSYQLGRARGMGAVSGLMIIALVMAACSVHWTARPLVFSYLTFLGLYYVTFMSPMSDRARIIATALIMMLWVNLHGSFLLGLLVLAIKFAFDLLELAWRKGLSKRILVVDLVAIAAAAAAICVNLRGPGFYTYVIDYLHHPMILFRSNEWRSLDFSLGFQTWSFLFLFVLVVACWAISGKRQSPSMVAVTCALFLLGVHTMRMVPYFALSALPAIGYSWSAMREHVLASSDSANAGWLQRACAWFFNLEKRIESQEVFSWKPVGVQVALTVAVLAVFVFAPQFRISDFDPKRMPVEATNFLQHSGMQKNLGFVYDNWGGYLYWRFREPIFIDDWTDFYPMEFLNQYVATITAGDGWKANLDRYGVSYALIPRDSNLSIALLQTPGWKRAYRDQCSDVFIRTDVVSTKNERRLEAGAPGTDK
jgi:hypothetical protein